MGGAKVSTGVPRGRGSVKRGKAKVGTREGHKEGNAKGKFSKAGYGKRKYQVGMSEGGPGFIQKRAMLRRSKGGHWGILSLRN